MKHLLAILSVLLIVAACQKTVQEAKDKDVRLCEDLPDSIYSGATTNDLYQQMISKDTIAAISKKIRKMLMQRRSLAYNESSVERYFNDNFSDQLSFEQFKSMLPKSANFRKKERWLSVFPVRVGVIVQPEFEVYVPEEDLHHSIEILNEAFFPADVQFKIVGIDTIKSPFTIENLKEDYWQNYFEFSKKHDVKDTISLYIFDNDPNLCESSGASVICGRTGGFSYVLSDFTNNIVLTKFEVGDQKVIAHEFGHFFGLYHTFETRFGMEKASGENCETAGDKICDTPADPGTAYEVYVNYTRCRMEEFKDEEKILYCPLINNYMSYYKPCYMRPYLFSQGQYDVIYNASKNQIRKNFIIEYVLHQEKRSNLVAK